MSAEGTRRAIVAAFLANLGIAISKFFAFAVTGSASMLAEGIHSIADTGNQGLLFLGGRRSRKPPTEEHPFGFGTERYFWAFIVALVLFTLGSLFALYEGVHKLLDPKELDSPIWAFAVLAIAIVLEGLSLRTARKEADPTRRGRSWWRFIRTTKSPELPVVLLEDTGALIGLVFAFIGISLAVITGNPRWDAVGSIGIGLLLGVIAVVLAIEMKSLLIGEAVSPPSSSSRAPRFRSSPARSTRWRRACDRRRPRRG
jgi:cation diffusion facilitator family transporter